MPAKTKTIKKSAKKTVSGGGGLKAAKRFSWKLALPLIALVAGVGGFMVYRSMAATAYQYSAFTCQNYSSRTDARTNTCIQESAEAVVFRAYKGVLGYNPDDAGYKHWSAELINGKKTYHQVVDAIAKTTDKTTAVNAMSAGELVNRLYTRVLGYTPSSADASYWQNQINDNKRTRDQVIAYFANTGKVSVENAKARVTGPDAKQYVTDLYKNMLGYTGSDADVKYWTGKIYSGEWSRGRVARHFIVQESAKKHHAAGAETFIRSKPRPVEETNTGGGTSGGGGTEGGGTTEETVPANVPADVRKAQEKRTEDAKKINAETQKIIDAMKERSADNNKRKEDAGKLAAKPEDKVTKGDVDSIEKNYLDVIIARQKGYEGKDYKGRVDANYSKVKDLRLQASANAKLYPGLTFFGVDTEWKKADGYRKEVTRHIENAKWLRGETAKAHTTAVGKYNLHQQHEALRRACQASGKTYQHSTNKCYQKGVVGGVQYYFEWILGAGGRLVCSVSRGAAGCRVPEASTGGSTGSGGGGSGGGDEAAPQTRCDTNPAGWLKYGDRCLQRYAQISWTGGSPCVDIYNGKEIPSTRERIGSTEDYPGGSRYAIGCVRGRFKSTVDCPEGFNPRNFTRGSTPMKLCRRG